MIRDDVDSISQWFMPIIMIIWTRTLLAFITKENMTKEA